MDPERTDLPPAPAAPVDDGGHIRFGRYRGETGPIDWRRCGPNRSWRFFHHKRWQYAAVFGPDAVAAVAIVDLGWASSAFAYVFDRRAGRVLADVSLTARPGAAR